MNIETQGSVVSNGSTNRQTPSPVKKQVLQLLEVTLLICVWIVQSFYYIVERLLKLTCNKPELDSVDGDIVLITGTGHGIGKQLALQYAEAGATVVGWDVNEKNNEDTINEINQRFKNKAKGYVCNVADRDDVLKTAKKVQDEIGQVKIVIANAGIMPCHLIEEHTHTEIRRIIDLNLMQLFWLFEAFLPAMKKSNRGHFVGISSIAGLAGFANLLPYCGTKFAVRGVLEALHEELRMNPNNKIGVTVVYPFMVNTGLCVNPILKYDAITKMLTPEEVARAIMKAQRGREFEVSIPGYILYASCILRLYPIRAVMKLFDLFDSGLGSDLVKKQ